MLLGPGLRALRRMRVPFAAAVVFAGLWLLGAIAPAPALAGFALIAAAALVENGRREAAPGKEREEARSAAGNDPGGLQAVLSGLPFPVIALSRREEVIALNGEASAIAPALRRGQSVLLGLRAPEVLQVMRRARARRSAQHAEIFERVPVERWYEVMAVPISLPDRMSAGDLVLLTFQDRTPLRRGEAMRADFVANTTPLLGPRPRRGSASLTSSCAYSRTWWRMPSNMLLRASASRSRSHVLRFQAESRKRE